VTPLGTGVETNWEALVAGRSGIRAIEGFDTSDFPTKIAGEVRDFNPEDWIEKKEIKRMDPFIQYAAAAAAMALEDAGVPAGPLLKSLPPPALVVGSSRGGVETLERAARARRVSAFAMSSSAIGMAAAVIAQKFCGSGPALGISSACASGAQAIGEGARLIRDGRAQVAVCGGADAPVTRLCLEGYGRAGALSGKNSPPVPFEKDRDGFALSEGAAIVVLEEYKHAVQRGARIYGEVAGYGNSTDAYHETRPLPRGQAEAMLRAVEDAGIGIEDIDLISAHATATPLGDRTEEEALRTAFGGGLSYRDKPVIALKAFTGHMLAASGPFEAAFVLKSMREGVIPGHIFLKETDSELNLLRENTRMKTGCALVNSFGFGGFNACLVLKAPEAV
jgi:3-oxoacyl-[acyl-carrier-protein] synthase II